MLGDCRIAVIPAGGVGAQTSVPVFATGFTSGTRPATPQRWVSLSWDLGSSQRAAVNLETNEADVLGRVERWARADDRVRAVLLTSSRVNPEAPRDVLSDYDVALLVTDAASFAADEAWPEAIGRPLLRVRDVVDEGGLAVHNCMVLYDDWAKIDFSIWPASLLDRIRDTGRLPDEFAGGIRVVLDKDRATDCWPAPAPSAWITEQPAEREFQRLVEEFWFVATYVAKYLWRDEFLAAKVIFDYELKYLVVRRMLDWRVGEAGGWSVAPGFFGRGLPRRLDAETWDAFEATFVGSDRDANWYALFATADLFRRVATDLAGRLGFSYPHEIDERMGAYLLAIRDLGPRPEEE